MFTTEFEMSELFETYIQNEYGQSYLKEQVGLTGRPDFLLFKTADEQLSVISIELKLKTWKKALQQAFRYKCFSNIAYVVLPSNRINPAKKNIDVFKQYNIGLASFDVEQDFNIIFEPKSSAPYSKVLSKKLIDLFNNKISDRDYNIN